MSKKLEVYPRIEPDEIPSFSILQHLGGTKVTEWYGRNRWHFDYDQVPFHSSLYCLHGLCRNVGSFISIERIQGYFKSTRRVDVLIPINITDQERDIRAADSLDRVNQPKIGLNLPTYSIFDFLRAEKAIRWLIPSSGKRICSEDVKREMALANVETSYKKPDETYPWDIYSYVWDNLQAFKLRTVWVGSDYAKKYNVPVIQP